MEEDPPEERLRQMGEAAVPAGPPFLLIWSSTGELWPIRTLSQDSEIMTSIRAVPAATCIRIKQERETLTSAAPISFVPHYHHHHHRVQPHILNTGSEREFASSLLPVFDWQSEVRLRASDSGCFLNTRLKGIICFQRKTGELTTSIQLNSGWHLIVYVEAYNCCFFKRLLSFWNYGANVGNTTDLMVMNNLA